MILGWAGGGNNNREGGERDTDRGTEQGFVLPRSSAMGDAEALWSFAVRRFRPSVPNPRAWEERGGKGDSVQVAPVVGIRGRRWPAPSSYGRGHGSSWGARWWHGEEKARLGAGRGGFGSAHHRSNRAVMASRRRSTMALVALFRGVEREIESDRELAERRGSASWGRRWRAARRRPL